LVGSDLFADSETYLQDLTDAELNQQGGLIWTITIVPATTYFLFLN
jgi:hypothetical protein